MVAISPIGTFVIFHRVRRYMVGSSSPCCKVGTAIVQYRLGEDFDEHLIDRWRGDGRLEAQGYRPLTKWFNQRLLKHEFDVNGLDATGARLRHNYDALADDESLQAEEVRVALTDAGVDVETLEGSFVSWSTMQRHLTDCLKAEKTREPARTDWERNSVEFAKQQLDAKVQSALSSLATKGTIPRGSEAEVSIAVEVVCPECRIRVPFETAIDRGYICPDHGIN